MGMCRYCERKSGFAICNGDCLRCTVPQKAEDGSDNRADLECEED